MRLRSFALLLAAPFAVAACRSNSAPAPATSASPAVVDAGACHDVDARLRAHPDLLVDQLPEVIAYDPPPLRHVPPSVMRRGYAEIAVEVVVDTNGRANMRTFKVVKSTHPWLSSNVKGVIRKWHFRPATLSGCKVPRLFRWSATAGHKRTK